MANVSKVNVNSTDYDIKDSNAMHKGVDYVTAGKKANTTLGSNATAEGYNTTASGNYSHAEGQNTIASGLNSHAEGSNTTASKPDAHAEGSYTTASGEQAHAEGSYTTASGYYAHSEGFYTTASGNHSHAEGVCTKASSPNQHVEGKYNVEDTNGTYAHIIGNGPSDSERKNIFTVNWDGDVNAGRSNGLTNDTKLPTGADVISYLNSNLSNVKIVYFEKVITLPDGKTTEQIVNVSVAEAVPNGYTLNGVLLLALGGFILPYISSGNAVTYVFGVDIYNKTISIVNKSSAWNNYTAKFILFMSKN